MTTEETAPQTLGHIDKADGSRVRVSIQVYKGHTGLDIRKVDKKGGRWLPTTQGVRIPLDDAEELAWLIGQAALVRQAKEKIDEMRAAPPPHAKGTNPRAKGTNPRAKGANPRAMEGVASRGADR